MPQNLNALIRYKQIDSCLRNRYLHSTIEVLQRKCSERLAEYRGVYKLVSERTIRDDIRVMRSGALGFDAPIVVSNGIYSYEDPDYSIFNMRLEDLDLLREITYLLIKERKNLNDPKLEKLIKNLVDIVGIDSQLYVEKPARVIKDAESDLSFDLDSSPKVLFQRPSVQRFSNSEPFDQEDVLETSDIVRWGHIFSRI